MTDDLLAEVNGGCYSVNRDAGKENPAGEGLLYGMEILEHM